MVARFRVNPAGEGTPLPHVWEHTVGSGRALAVTGRHPTVDVWAFIRGRDLTLLLTNHTFPRQPIESEAVRFEVTGSGPRGRAFVRRIDNEHANAPAAWREMGAPEYPSRRQVEELAGASRLTEEAVKLEGGDDLVLVTIELPPHAVAAVTLEGIVP